MRIAILGSDYHLVRMMEMLLKRERHTVTCFGKIDLLRASPLIFDLLIFDPGRPFSAPLFLMRIADWRPEVRRILITPAYENAKLAQEQKLRMLYWPCTRQLFLAMVNEQKTFLQEGYSRGT